MPIFTHQFDTDLYKGSVTLNTDLFINNEWVTPIEGNHFEVINPSTGARITDISLGTSKDVDVAVSAARKSFKTSWGLNVTPSFRANCLLKLADIISHNIDAIAAIETLDVGTPFTMTKYFMIPGAVETLKYYAGLAGKTHGHTKETNPLKFGYTRREPHGVVAAITPWNSPLPIAIAKIAPALITGNTVVLKPSEFTPLSALLFASFISEAGFPPGVINIVNGLGEVVGTALSHHPDINFISFTGSSRVGRLIAKASAESNLKKVALELGGKSPNVIFADVEDDLDEVLTWSERGIFALSGQMCSAGSRIFVQEQIYDKFVQKFTEIAEKRIVGDPFNPATVQGPAAYKGHLDRVIGYIDAGIKEGAKLVTGGKALDKDGYFVQPTIFTEVTPEMSLFRDESFGPIAAIIKFKTEEEVIQLANDTSYGLVGALFTKDLNRAIRVSNAIEAGTIFVNCFNWIETPLPWTGYKQSGWGSENGEEVLEHYMQVKSVHINLGLKVA
ncbi:aldehyde dehydrogenase [Abortiporus biennis]|nr:aldehyde dehydrogenase [Abortiporus biennis]